MAYTYGTNFGMGVDPRLKAILESAAENFPEYDVEFFSGKNPRSTGTKWHPSGVAVDLSLINKETGKKLPNYQNGKYFRTYEQFAQEARRKQQEMYPELNNQFRWGGYFSGPPRKYGAVDLMHYDIGGSKTGMAGGNWMTGLTERQRRLWPSATSIGMADSGVLPSAIAAREQGAGFASPGLPAPPASSPGIQAGLSAPPGSTSVEKGPLRGIWDRLNKPGNSGASPLQGLLAGLASMGGSGGDEAPQLPNAQPGDDMASVMGQGTIKPNIQSPIVSPFGAGGDPSMQDQPEPSPDQLAQMTPEQIDRLRKLGLLS